MSPEVESACLQAAALIRDADALMITAGAGMGVDSGLPDFRGNEGFWNAYPPFRERNLSFVDLANPTWFESDPRQAWGFYGHRQLLYRETQPHHGFHAACPGPDGVVSGSQVWTVSSLGDLQRTRLHRIVAVGLCRSQVVEAETCC